MPFHEIYILLAAFVSEILGTLGGFGSSTFFVPIAQFFENLKTVLALTAVLHIFGNLSKLYFFRKGLGRTPILLLGVPSWIAAALGAELVEFVPVDFLTLVLGVLITSLALLFYFKPHLTLPKKKILLVSISALSGFFTGLVGTGGAIRGLALTSLGFAKLEFLAVSAAIDIGGDIVRGGFYLGNGYLTRSHLFYIPLLLGCAVLGNWIGKKILSHIPEKTFRTGVLALIALSGITTIVKNFI